jgi:general secretion pathway protein L
MALLLGIEISDDAVRGAVLKTALRRVQVARYVEVPILRSGEVPRPAEMNRAEGGETRTAPAGLFFGDRSGASGPEGSAASTDADSPDPVELAVGELLRQVGPPRPTVIAALPGDGVSVRRIEVPAAAAKKIEELLPFEMEALSPFDASQTLLDHQPIDTVDGKLRVLAVAAPKDRVRAHLAQLARWGIEPEELAVGAVALDGLPSVVPSLATEGPHLVIHFGERRTEVCMLRCARVELARTIRAGIRDLGDGSLATSASSVAQMGATADGFMVRGAMTERLARELKQTIAAWRLHGGERPATVHLSGVGLHDPRIVSWVGEVLGQDVELLAVPDTTPSIGFDPHTRARFGMAVALAARTLARGKRINLRKGEFEVRATTGFVRQHAALFAGCLLSVVCAFFFSAYARWSALMSRRAVLENELARVTRNELGEETRSPSRARALLAAGGSRTDPLPRFTALDALAAISSAIPSDIRHDVQRLHIDLGDGRSGGRFELSGIVGTIEERDRIAQALGQVECFRNLELGPLTQAPHDRRSYRIEAEIRCPGDEGGEAGPSKRRGGRSRSRGSVQGGGS